ncbi:MAG: hypothetical protein COA43_07535 [Robiginitomaculum sp.]|nr:MAG: hypothetical protein COA43_07535 [Robiginitomaculum sp.]
MINLWQALTYTTLFALSPLCTYAAPNTKPSSSLAIQDWIKNLGNTIPLKSEIPNGYNLQFYPATYTTIRRKIPVEQKRIVGPCVTLRTRDKPPILMNCPVYEVIQLSIPTVRISRAIQSPPILQLTSNSGAIIKSWRVDDPEKYKNMSD